VDASSGFDAAAPVDLATADHALSPGADAAGAHHDYTADGPWAVSTVSAMVDHGGATFAVQVDYPQGVTGSPVVVFVSGLLQPGAAYAPYGHRLASWGIATVRRDDPGFSEQTSSVADDAAFLVTSWIAAVNADASSPLHGALDPGRVGLAGHSRGGQVALLAAEGAAKGHVQGVFTIDPVDSAMGSSARTTLESIGVPTVFLGETTDSVGGVLGMPCAPAADNFQALFAVAASPAVQIDVLNADHTQFEDPASCSLCNFCTAGTANATEVLGITVKYTTAFFGRVLLADVTVGDAFVGVGVDADVTAGRIEVSAK
jgi:dienelactone hydrolase